MKEWTVLAGKHAAVIAGAGISVPPAIGSATLDSFALGALAAGTCLAALAGNGRGTAGPLQAGGPGSRLAPGNASLRAARVLTRARSAMDSRALAVRGRIGGVLTGLFGDHSGKWADGDAERPDEDFWGPYSNEASQGGYRSRHRLTDPSQAPKKTGGRRSMPRHAAPPLSFSRRATGHRYGPQALAPSWDH